MVKRVLNRNEGRVDDNLETIKKRLTVFQALSLPVINYYSEKGKLYTIKAIGTEDEIFEQVRPIFAAFENKIVLLVNFIECIITCNNGKGHPFKYPVELVHFCPGGSDRYELEGE
ncbi:hypothetical protein GOBAR_AA20899 [Gossypium barbadense]|uniref:adenylate kinase n=1 Tax=Gossypium barbadense TaxID=3634 RepID=A0A2P5X8W9_GOSBA|nr:hypothetical protein GOBAR_AA20899 [Gossypium barbadense]